jgi:RNA polymerase sigma-70 factor (ECF subfamily)
MTEEMLISRARQGDRAALGELVNCYQGKVYNLALKLLAVPADAADITQETLIKVCHSLDSFRSQASLSTWIYRVAVNLCLDQLRRRSRERKLLTYATQIHDPPSVEAGPEERAIERETLREVRAAINALPVDFRLVLVLHHYQNLSYREIAAVAGIPEKTVATRLHRAKLLLKEKLLGGESQCAATESRND